MTPQTLVQEVHTLFSLPDVALRVNELVGDPAASIQDLAAVIQLDAGLTVNLLRLANSAWYGLPAMVETVSQAVTLIGLDSVQQLALAASVANVFKGIPEEFVDMNDFWDNSTTCGVLARNLGRLCRIGGVERLFTAGLLHGVGKLVFYARRPEAYRAVLQSGVVGEQAVATEERRVFGFTSAELGAELLKAWNLPEVLWTAVAYRLEPALAPAHQREVAIVHVAGDMAAYLTPDVKTAQRFDDYRPGFDEAAWTLLGLEREVLPEIMQASLLEAVEILDIVNPRATLIY